MTDSTSWFERLTDTYADFGLTALIVLLMAIGIAVLVYHIYFRWRLEPAVDRGISPQTVRFESLATALAVGALIAGFSGWGFIWVAGVLLFALVFAFMAKARGVMVGVAGVIAIAVLVALQG